MRRRIAAVILTVVAITSGLCAEEPERKSLWKRLTSAPPLPTELTADVDVFPMARSVTPRHPLSFKPFGVSKLHTGWIHMKGSAGGFPIGRSIRIGGGSTQSDQRFSFTMNEGDQPRWVCDCAWSATKDYVTDAEQTSSIAGTLRLHCDFAEPQGVPKAWSLEWDVAAGTQDLGPRSVTDGRLISSTSEFRIAPLYAVRDSKVLGDISGGYVFHTGSSAVAALTLNGPGGPGRFTVSHSVSAADRSLLAAATAALLLNERFMNSDSDFD